MAGDTWSKSRSEDPEAVADTQTHNNHVTAALYTEIHTAVRGRRRSFTKHHHHPFPRVSLTPFLPHTHTHTHYSVSLTHTYTQIQLPGGSMLSMRPVENHYSAEQTKEPRVNFLFECSVFLFSTAPSPIKQGSKP